MLACITSPRQNNRPEALAPRLNPTPAGTLRHLLQSLAATLLLAAVLNARGQSTLVYDQQSATTPLVFGYDSFDISRQLLYQSFVPTLPSIGFVQLQLWDYLDTNTSGARICVCIYNGSPGSFNLIGTTKAVYLPADFSNDQLIFSGVTNFYFSSPVSLTIGQTYYLQPIELTGDSSWAVVVAGDTYANGTLYGFNGTDLWFREGIVETPEPPVFALWAAGGLLLLLTFRLEPQNKNPRSAFPSS